MITTRRAASAFAVIALLVVSYLIATSMGFAGFSASVNNSTNTIGTGTSFLTASKAGTTQCTSVPTGSTIPATQNFTCSGTQLPATTAATGNSTSAELLSATGTVPFTSASYDANSCAPVQLNNNATTTNPMLVRGGVGFNGAANTKLTNSGSLLFNGTDTLGVNVAQATGLQNFTLGIWFKTSVAQGALYGWSSSSSNIAASTYDRHLYLTSTGTLGFASYSGATRIITSTASYTDNNWHYAVITGKSAVTTTTSTITMYVDGTQVATSTFANAAAAESTSGYWRVGQAQTNQGGYTGNGQYFNGSLSDFTVFPTVLTTAQMTGLYNAGTQAGYETASTAAGATSLWPLADNGTATYTGTLPGNAANPCLHVRVTVGTASACLYPVLATACPAVSSTYTLAGLATAAATPLTPSTTSTSQTITTTTARDTTYNANYDVGLHLLVPITVTERGFTQTFQWNASETII